MNLEGNGNSLRARITFRDATPAEQSVIEKQDDIGLIDDARKRLSESIIGEARRVSNTETRKADYVKVLKDILTTLGTPNDQNTNELLQNSKIKTLLPSGFPSGTDTLSAKVTALESIIAGLS